MSATTKGSVRTDMKYVREVLRQMEDALREGDFVEVAFLANEAAACLIGVMDINEKGD